MNLQQKIQDSLRIIEQASTLGQGVLAYSGGKDGIVTGHLVNQIIKDIPMICETSFYFPEIIEDTKIIADQLNFNVTYNDSLSDKWLRNHPEYLFAECNKIKARSYFVRHQKTMKSFAKSKNADVTFTGRRTQENCVKAEIYKTKNNGMQCHPLRAWTTKDIWEYMETEGIFKPRIYNTQFGSLVNNAPFYALKPSQCEGSKSIAWNIIREASPKQTFETRFR